MSKYQSSMRAELSSTECERIDEAWSRLRFIAALPSDLDPTEMLPAITDIVLACYDCRMAITEGWHAANLRRFPPEPRAARPPRGVRIFRDEAPSKLHNDIAKIMGEMSEEDINRLFQPKEST